MSQQPQATKRIGEPMTREQLNYLILDYHDSDDDAHLKRAAIMREFDILTAKVNTLSVMLRNVMAEKEALES